MLEFYPVHPIRNSRLSPIFFAFVRAPALALAVALLLAGCATTGAAPEPPPKPTAPPLPRTAEPPPPPVNLSGFPLPYRQGYADGCASATGPERKDGARYGSDGNYRTGWIDGLALCKRK
jgi:hypothetical protein